MNNNYNNPTRAYIDLGAFRHNIGIVRKKFPKSKIILPVKANAYGHGADIISKEAEKIGVEYLAVARINEGIKLRNDGIRLPIMTLGVEFPENVEIALLNNIELSVSQLENVIEIEQIADSLKSNLSLHLKIDTGMTRLGCKKSDILEIAGFIKASKYLTLKSVYTHFARSDDSKDFTNEQITEFLSLKKLLIASNMEPEFYHTSNSGAILEDYNNDSDFAVRPGIMVYGYSPFDKVGADFNLIPVMTLKSKVVSLKEVPENTGVSYNHTFKTQKPAILATIPVGYGDGIFRNLSNKFSVTIGNKNFFERGTISMDLTVIEVDSNVKIGDDVIIFGKKSECINDAKDLAFLAGTISYEITTAITERVERISVN